MIERLFQHIRDAQVGGELRCWLFLLTEALCGNVAGLPREPEALPQDIGYLLTRGMLEMLEEEIPSSPLTSSRSRVFTLDQVWCALTRLLASEVRLKQGEVHGHIPEWAKSARWDAGALTIILPSVARAAEVEAVLLGDTEIEVTITTERWAFPLPYLSLIHISEPTDQRGSRMPSSA